MRSSIILKARRPEIPLVRFVEDGPFWDAPVAWFKNRADSEKTASFLYQVQQRTCGNGETLERLQPACL